MICLGIQKVPKTKRNCTLDSHFCPRPTEIGAPVLYEADLTGTSELMSEWQVIGKANAKCEAVIIREDAAIGLTMSNARS